MSCDHNPMSFSKLPFFALVYVWSWGAKHKFSVPSEMLGGDCVPKTCFLRM